MGRLLLTSLRAFMLPKGHLWHRQANVSTLQVFWFPREDILGLILGFGKWDTFVAQLDILVTGAEPDKWSGRRGSAGGCANDDHMVHSKSGVKFEQELQFFAGVVPVALDGTGPPTQNLKHTHTNKYLQNIKQDFHWFLLIMPNQKSASSSHFHTMGNTYRYAGRVCVCSVSHFILPPTLVLSTEGKIESPDSQEAQTVTHYIPSINTL